MINCVIQCDTEKKMSICGKCVGMVKMKEEITLKGYKFVKRDDMTSVHGILQARILEWVAMPFSRGLS